MSSLSVATGQRVLDDLFADPGVTEVLVDGPGRPVRYERHGRLRSTEAVLDAHEVRQVVERLVGPTGRRVDLASPVVDARLADGSRVNVVIPPIAVDGPYITVRRFAREWPDLDDLCGPDEAGRLRALVASRTNLVVSGGTGAGKTTLLAALLGEVPSAQRVVVIEDATELPDLGVRGVRLEARPANAEGAGRVAIADLVRTALRMRPDRIVVGEVRGAEAFDLLQALNTGHDGSMATVHANGAADAMARLELLALQGAADIPLAAVAAQLRRVVGAVVHVERRPDGSRHVAEIAELVGGVEDDAEAPAVRRP